MFNILYEISSHIKNNKGASIITIGTIAVSMAILGAFLLIFFNFKNMSKGLGEDISLIVYLEDDISNADKNALIKTLKKKEEIEEITMISKDEALSIFKNDLGGDSIILDGLTTNPLPASIKVKVGRKFYTPKNLSEIAALIKNKNGVESVDYGMEWLEKFKAVMIFSKIVLLSVGSLLFIGLIFIIANTIRLSLYANIKEIEIMKLVGASDWYIKTPFIVEGMVSGFLGSCSSILVLLLAFKLFMFKISKLAITITILNSITFIPTSYIVIIIIAGTFIGCMGSFFSVQSFLKEN